MPRSLQQGEPVRFRFKSPLHDTIEQQKGQKFLEAKAMIAEAVALDPSTAQIPDVKVALRDVLYGIGVPAKWVRNEAEVREAIEAQAAQQQTEQLLGTLQQGADVAKTTGEAAQLLPGGVPA